MIASFVAIMPTRPAQPNAPVVKREAEEGWGSKPVTNEVLTLAGMI
jgi:hypothetical protein